LQYWPDDWDTDLDTQVKKNWGTDVPEGVWPDNDEEAEEFFIEMQQTYGCPFAWLLEFA